MMPSPTLRTLTTATLTTEDETPDESDNEQRCIYKIFWLTTFMIIKDNEYILADNCGEDESFQLSIDAIDVIMCHICYYVVYITVSCYEIYGITHVSCYICVLL